MTEYDYSPEAYDRYLATQNRIAKWVDETEQHRPQFQHAVNVAQQHQHQHHHREPSRRRQKPNLYIQPPPSSDSGSSSSEEVTVSAPAHMYPAQPQPRYPGPPVAVPSQPLISPPPPMMPMVYPNQRPPYYPYPQNQPQHHRAPSRSHTVRSSHRSSHHSPAYYSLASTPQRSPVYSHQFAYPPPAANQRSHPGYMIAVPPPQPPHQPVVYLRA